MYVTGVNMASQVEDNKLECNVCEMSEEESNIRRIYEDSKKILNSPDESFSTKAESLVNVWEKIKLSSSSTRIEDINHLLHWAKQQTLNIVLAGEWKNFKAKYEKKLVDAVDDCEKELQIIHNSFIPHCRKLSKVILDPWGNSTLCQILNTQDPVITRTEFDFFFGESGTLVSMRLKKLYDSHCEDLALNLITAYMRCCEWAEANNLNMNLTDDQKRFFFDVNIALLYKYKLTTVILTKLKALPLLEGLELVQRFATKSIAFSKMWRYSNNITHFAAVLFASSALLQPNTDDILTKLVSVWLGINEKEENFISAIKKLMKIATSACQMYIFCEAVFTQFGPKMKTFNIELYIQALNTDLNYLERQKTENNKEEQTATSKRLAQAFLRLADVLDEHIIVYRECVLTSFSLQPTKECLQRIEAIASKSGFEVLDTGQWKCKMHPPVEPSDELCVECSVCGEFMSQMQLEAAINTNVALNEALTAERLGLSPELCDDLVVILCSPRYQLLSWLQKWPQLHRLCIMYLNDSERTKNLVTELKFLEIDYSLFIKVKQEPQEVSDEYTTENTAYDSTMDIDYYIESEELKKQRKKPGRKKRSQTPEATYIPPKASSDPEVLKTLRSFRRSLKRPRNGDVEGSSPSKIAHSDPPCSSTTQQNHSKNLFQNIFQSPSINLYTQPVNSSENVEYFHSNFNNYNSYCNRGLGNSSLYNYSQISNVNNDNCKNKTAESCAIPESTIVKDNAAPNEEKVKGFNSTPSYLYELLYPDWQNNAHKKWCVEVVEKYRALKNKQRQIYGNHITSLADKGHININDIQQMAKELQESESHFLEYPLDKNNCSIKDNSNEVIINDPPFQHDEKIRWSDEKVPPWEENRDPNIHEELGELSDMSSRYLGSDEDDWYKEIRQNNYYVKQNDDNLSDQKNSYDTCSRENLIKDDEEPNGEFSCVLEILKNHTAISEHLLSKTDESRFDNCQLCHEQDWKVLKELATTNCKSDTPKYIDLLKKLEDSHEPKKIEQKPKSKEEFLKEKYHLKELIVVLNRCDIKLNKNFNYLSKIFNKRLKRRKHTKKLYKKSENKSKVQSPTLNKDEYTTRSFPLQDINPRVSVERLPIDKYKINKYEKKNKSNSNDDDKPNKNFKNKLDKYYKQFLNNDKVLKVRIERLNVEQILANVPGMNDTAMIQPSYVNNIVQVVQLAGGRPTPTPNNQTSTQVSPHIQRIGQPRIEKPDPATSETNSTTTNTKTSTTVATSKPATSQPSTLINILSQQIIRPGQSNSRPRSGQFVNILSQQIIRPANTSVTTVKMSDTQTNTTNSRTFTTGEPQVINQLMNPIRSTATAVKTVVSTPGSDQSRIVQLICKSADGKLIPVTSFTPNRVVKVATTQTVTSSSPNSPNTFDESMTKLVTVSPKGKNDTDSTDSLPKFQQAFGKTVYQNSVDSTSTTTNTTESDKLKTQPKTSTVVQPLQGGVIYTRQVPVGQTINLIPNNRGQVFRIATSNSEQISLVKDNSVIQSKMNALLTAALQGKQKNSEVIEVDSSDTPVTQTTTRLRPTLVHNARIVKPVLQIPAGNVVRSPSTPNLSSTTLEQLREFDMVYKQVKERSSTSTPSDATTATTETTEASPKISVFLNQSPKINCSPVVVVSSYNNLQPAASPALSIASQGSSSPCVTPAPTPAPVLPKNVAAKGSKGKSVKNAAMHTSKASPVPKPQQKPQEDEHTTQRIFDILAEYAEQLRNSPDLNNKPAPRRRSNPPTNPNQNSKRKKSSSSKKTGQCSSTLTSEADLEDVRTVGSEDSSCGVVQVSMQEEDTTPPPTNATESNDAVQPRQQLILTESGTSQTRNLIIADSSVGEALKMPNTAVLVPGNYIMPVSMVKGGQQIAVVSGGSKILATVPARSGPNMLLFQSFLNQNRKTVPTVKYSTIQPITGISTQTITGVNTQQPVILQQSGINAVALSQQMPLKKIEESDRLNTELLLTISQSRDNESSPSDEIPQPDSSTSVVTTNIESIDLEENATLSDTSSEKTFTYQKPLVSTPIATPVIAQTNAKEDVVPTNKVAGNTTKSEERVQSVLVSAGTSNGPMLAHSPPHYTKTTESTANETNKDEFLRNGGKRTNATETKTFQSNNLYTIHGKIKKASTQKIDRELQQLCLQRKQAALERELRLQKSLSEECEDLGVDEPSTSDLFPEADLLFDSNHSPSFDQSSQDIIKRSVHQETKEESKLTLFCDDDFLFEPGEYQTAEDETELEYENQPRLLTNGQSSTRTESSSPGGDHTLLQTCTSMSDVTLNSPISPENYNATTPPPLNKYIHKYSNKKKDKAKQVEHWHTTDVSSSEDTTGSTELKSLSRSPDICANKRSDEELSDGGYKVVRVAISKECEEMHCGEDMDCSLSGRGARRSVKKMCSCCNGSQEANNLNVNLTHANRKRQTSHPHGHTPHKKAFLKKR